MSLDTAVGRPALVLLVDPVVATRHWMWRAMSRAFGVLEAGSARAARDWIEQRPDIDALVTQDELPDARGAELVEQLARASHPVASRSIVLVRSGIDLRAVLSKLAGWFLTRDAGLARALLREADRLSA
jgi:response regulator RpfG family c-di-GMP phosphodiesterase